ncbi:MAG: hypothetical protein NTW86_24200 [Candidatus Sumerlaeota bacterium]|nr:hypothetical protein [Candidatus Sumerlaeota bacterium]
MRRSHPHFAPRRIALSSRRRGVTLVETMIASSVMVMMSMAVITAFVYLARVEKGVASQMRVVHQGKSILDALTQEVLDADLVLEGKSGDLNQGTRVDITHTGSATVAFYIADTDKDLTTISDNVLVYDPDIATNGDEQILARMVSPLSGCKVFECSSATQPLQVRLRIGDASGAAKTETDRTTGPGFQSLVINTSFAVRTTQG